MKFSVLLPVFSTIAVAVISSGAYPMSGDTSRLEYVIFAGSGIKSITVTVAVPVIFASTTLVAVIVTFPMAFAVNKPYSSMLPIFTSSTVQFTLWFTPSGHTVTLKSNGSVTYSSAVSGTIVSDVGIINSNVAITVLLESIVIFVEFSSPVISPAQLTNFHSESGTAVRFTIVPLVYSGWLGSLIILPFPIISVVRVNTGSTHNLIMSPMAFSNAWKSGACL